MEDNRPQYLQEEEYDEIDIMELVRKLMREWKLILVWCGIAAVVGLVVGFSIPKEYSVSSKLAPELVSKSGGGSLGSLASLAGINLSSMSTSDAVYPDLYPDIVSSTPFIVELFPVQVEFKDGKADYYTYLKEYTRSPWWTAVTKAPFKALGWFMGLFREKKEPVEGFANLDPSRLTEEQETIAKAIRGSIVLTVDKKTSVISLTVTAQDPLVAARISEEVIDSCNPMWSVTVRKNPARTWTTTRDFMTRPRRIISAPSSGMPATWTVTRASCSSGSAPNRSASRTR